MVGIHEIGFGGLKLLQDDEAYRYGVDAVLLADFCRCPEGAYAADLGTDTGVIPLIICAKYAPAKVFGVELRKDAAELAVRNAELNGLSDRISILNSDIKDCVRMLTCGAFDLVCSNPPYFEAGKGLHCANGARQTARTETSARLSDFMQVSSRLLKKGGSLCMIHRPSRLADLMTEARAAGLEPKELRMVAPHSGEPANLVLLRFIKGAGKELRILPELAVRMADGSYTDEMKRIYEY